MRNLPITINKGINAADCGRSLKRIMLDDSKLRPLNENLANAYPAGKETTIHMNVKRCSDYRV